MTLRNSLHSSFNDPDEGVAISDISDYQSVDRSSSFLSRTLMVCVQLWWIFIICAGLAAVSLPYLFPQWAKSYQDELRGISSATDTSKLLRNIAGVDWREAFTKENMNKLKYVGTGLHPIFRLSPTLKENWFYTGEVLMMKTYVADYDMLSQAQRAIWNKKGGLRFPAVGVEHGEAAEYCASLGPGYRLPEYEELTLAYLLHQEKLGQGSVGDALKPNLILKLFESKSLWTLSPQPSQGWFSAWKNNDNFRVFTSGRINRKVYQDDGFESGDLGFLCVKEIL